MLACAQVCPPSAVLSLFGIHVTLKLGKNTFVCTLWDVKSKFVSQVLCGLLEKLLSVFRKDHLQM